MYKGKWLNIFDDEIKTAYNNILSKLKELGDNNLLIPKYSNMFLPLFSIDPDKMNTVFMCLRPYRTYVSSNGTLIPQATDYPIEVPIGTPPTPTKTFFMELLSTLEGDTKIMMTEAYRNMGILILNAVTTYARCPDERYSLTYDHAPLWANFYIPLITMLINRNIKIVLLGKEAKDLATRISVNHPNLYRFPFPTEETFHESLGNIAAIYGIDYKP